MYDVSLGDFKISARVSGDSRDFIKKCTGLHGIVADPPGENAGHCRLIVRVTCSMECETWQSRSCRVHGCRSTGWTNIVVLDGQWVSGSRCLGKLIAIVL